MSTSRPRTNAQWLADLGDRASRAAALSDLREYLLRAVYLYLDRHRTDLADLDRHEIRQLAEDFAQEALLQILDHLETFRGESKFTTWAYRFVINVAAGELRRHRWRTLSLEALADEHEIRGSVFIADRAAPDLETRAARERVLSVIREVIEHDLTERQRIALVNIHFRAVPTRVVADRLGITPNAVYKLVHDARKKLKQGLVQRHYSEADVVAIFED
jgi:RNA polymerase sigma-70 factor (ECF subfamily)